MPRSYAIIVALLALILIAFPVSAQSTETAQQEYEQMVEQFSADLTLVSDAVKLWAEDELQKTVLEEALSTTMDNLLAVDVQDCFAHAWGLRYSWLILVSTDIANMESSAQVMLPSPHSGSSLVLAQMASVVSVDC